MAETLGRYELIAEIGRGGMADVKLALQRGQDGLDKLVVLKLVHEELANDKAIVAMLLEEGKLSAQIKHPNVVETYEIGEADGKSFIAMEYLEGEPLLAVLDKGTTGKRLDPLSMARIAADAAAGLDAAHDLKSVDGKPLGIVHHDISLGNIFVLYSGQVKLLDFGVAKAQHSAKKKDEKVFVGKLAYMAPEKLDERPGDRRSDIWSLGCVMWEALTHKRLFKGANDVEIMREVRYVNVPPPSTLNRDVPVELDAIVQKALQRDPSRRYANAKEMAVAIEDVLAAKSYPAKNYKIGTYMMASFEDVIAARERLLREVAGPTNRPSAEVIEAVFGEVHGKRESSLPAFDLDAILAPANQVVLPEGSTGATAAVPDLMSTTTEAMDIPNAPVPQTATVSVANPFDDDGTETIFDDVPANAEASRALRYEADPSWVRGKHGERLKELQKKAQEMRDNPGAVRRRKLRNIAIGGGVALVAMIVIIAKACGGDDAKQPAPVAKPADTPQVVIDAAVAAVAVDAPAAVVSIDAAVIAEEIEMPPEELASSPDEKPEEKPEETKPERPKPTKSAQVLYAEGLAAWKKKDVKAAYALFTEGRRASSKYPNNWYGLGLVHEKAGRKKDARYAYERYLKLAPNAPNSNKLRDHIKKNLM